MWILLKQDTVSEWQWHQLGHMQVCTSLQTDNHASNPALSFSLAGCPSCRPTNSVKALKATVIHQTWLFFAAPQKRLDSCYMQSAADTKCQAIQTIG